ncbi:M61 family metallopeptidase [Sphingomonas montana]|uniref:M61 family metallopeptidase n=1 Tax=Sphingomonas montana TaxID=1843236 RepID=UPI0013ED0068|nr:M61 family metallopeptidase [Sphingomonas montana]
MGYHSDTQDNPVPEVDRTMSDVPVTVPQLPGPNGQGTWTVTPQDVEYSGVLELEIDTSDTVRGIFLARLLMPVLRSGRMTLLYPKWMPGYHSPQNPIELFAGLEIRAGNLVLDWRRDPVEVYAFHIDVPDGTSVLDISFQFLSPTTSTQGDVVVTEDILNLQWGRALLYPAGYFTRRITVRPRVKLPKGWQYATVLETHVQDGDTVTFAPVRLDILVDSPVMAGRHHHELMIDPQGTVRMNLFAHQPADLAITTEQVAFHAALVTQADKLFGARHFDSYRFLVALSDELGGGGIEHHRSAEIVAPPSYFRQWEQNRTKRDVFAHEFTHSWNGKFRRGADSWTPSFEIPIRNSLMWLYEGQTQYWGHVLTARAGLWSMAASLEALAKIAATYDVRPGGLWRTMADTTEDPVINGRAPLPWPSWQRNEDYYSEGQLMWLAVDTLIREASGDQKSLDDFARAFFGMNDGRMTTRTYDLEEVVSTLNDVVAHDWAAFLDTQLHRRREGAPLEGLDRGGYRLVYRDHRTDFCRSYDAQTGQLDLRFSIGLTIAAGGTVQEVMWGSAAFDAGLTAGALIQAVNGQAYDETGIGNAVAASQGGARPFTLTVKARSQSRPREVTVNYDAGHRFPHLEPIVGTRPRLNEILTAR